MGLLNYRLKKDTNLRSQGYRHPPRQAVRVQMALMYEVLALKKPLDHEAEERALHIRELKAQIRDKKKQGQNTKGIQDQVKRLQQEAEGKALLGLCQTGISQQLPREMLAKAGSDFSVDRNLQKSTLS